MKVNESKRAEFRFLRGVYRIVGHFELTHTFARPDIPPSIPSQPEAFLPYISISVLDRPSFNLT